MRRKERKLFFKICNGVTKGNCRVGFAAAPPCFRFLYFCFPAPTNTAPTATASAGSAPLYVLASLFLEADPALLLLLSFSNSACTYSPFSCTHCSCSCFSWSCSPSYYFPYYCFSCSCSCASFSCFLCCYCSFIRKGSISIKHKVFTSTEASTKRQEE